MPLMLAALAAAISCLAMAPARPAGKLLLSALGGLGSLLILNLLSPVTGYPVNNTLRSATVICEDGTMADALSTALYILGENRAINYWRTYGGFEMILVTNDNRIVCTKGLIDNFTQTVDSYKLSFTE